MACRSVKQGVVGVLAGAILAAFAPVEVAAVEPIKIGAVLPFSGGVELYGGQGRLGLELAMADINAAGGILGRPVAVVFRDDGTRPNIASEAARKAVEEDGVLAVVGPITSQNLDAIVPVLAERRTPLLYATNYEGGKCSRYMFALNTVPNQELDSLLPYMTKTFGGDYFLLGADRDWPHRMFDAAGPVIARLGGKVVDKQYTLGAEKDFASLADRVVASKAKILLYALKGDGMQFIPYASERGVFRNTTVAFLGLTEADLKAFGGKVDNIHAAVPFVVSSEDPKAKAFTARARAKAGPDKAISNYVEAHYNALFAIKAALEKAGKVDKEALIDALEGVTFDSPAGPVTIGRDHHATLDMFLAKTRGPQLLQVQALGAVAPKSGCTAASVAR
ncbi:MAG: ABC transporter substrate-binding protein [Reyranella sp.]|uniref:ABC transporter substrate-binding protein n=1 Tax=Reyranella sp. TaxID=1929291 RepID=UPI001AC25D27|nr:ABC transporter substrate-binding protein [Reyranella sp.]MBN9088252.1 ABC transporter substrate-binding protein [Reyranella sp.]